MLQIIVINRHFRNKDSDLNLHRESQGRVHSNRQGRIQNMDHLPCDGVLYLIVNARDNK
jgi:hypothetical protein